MDKEESGGAVMHLFVEGEQIWSPSQSFRVAHGDPIEWAKGGWGGKGVIYTYLRNDRSRRMALLTMKRKNGYFWGMDLCHKAGLKWE